MTSNAYLEWPMWNYFTLNQYNTQIITDPVRLYKFLGSYNVSKGVSVDKAEKKIDASLADDIENVVKNTMFYVFMDDKILRGSDINKNIHMVLLVGQYDIPDHIPDDDYVILKGIGKKDPKGRIVGGTIAPFIGTKKYMSLIREQTLSETKGEKYSIKANLSKDDQDHINTLLLDPKYEDLISVRIIDSYKKSQKVTKDLSKAIKNIRAKIEGVVPEGKAVNVETGVVIGLRSCTKYTVQEYHVSPKQGGVSKVIKFAFRNSMDESLRKELVEMLESNFNATIAKTTEVIPEKRESAFLGQVKMTGDAYMTYLRGTESMKVYLAKINEMSNAIPKVDTSQILTTEPPKVEEEQEEEDIEEESEGEEEEEEYEDVDLDNE